MVDLGNEQHALAIRQPFSLKPLFLYLEDGIPIRPAGLFNHNALIEINQADLESASRSSAGRARRSTAPAPSAGPSTSSRPARRPRPTPQPRSARSGDRLLASRRARLGHARARRAGRRRLRLAAARRACATTRTATRLSATLRAEARLDAATTLAATATASALDTDTDGALDSLGFFGGGTTSLQTFSYRRVEAARGALRLDRVWGSRQLTSVDGVRARQPGRPEPVLPPPPDRPGECDRRGQRAALPLARPRRRSTSVYPGWRGARLVAGATADGRPETTSPATGPPRATRRAATWTLPKRTRC